MQNYLFILEKSFLQHNELFYIWLFNKQPKSLFDMPSKMELLRANASKFSMFLIHFSFYFLMFVKNQVVMVSHSCLVLVKEKPIRSPIRLRRRKGKCFSVLICCLCVVLIKIFTHWISFCTFISYYSRWSSGHGKKWSVFAKVEEKICTWSKAIWNEPENCSIPWPWVITHCQCKK